MEEKEIGTSSYYVPKEQWEACARQRDAALKRIKELEYELKAQHISDHLYPHTS